MSPYSAALMDHCLSPRNAGPMESPDGFGEGSLGGRAPRVTVFLRFDGDYVSEARFLAFGCGVIIALASALTESVQGRTISECLAISAADLEARLEGVPEHKQFCTGIVLSALQAALVDLQRKRSAEGDDREEAT